MKSTTIALSTVALVIAGVLVSRQAISDTPAAPTEPGKDEVRAVHQPEPASTGRSWNAALGLNPFAVGEPVKVDQQILIRERLERMRKGKYNTPEPYYHMSLKQLQQLAHNGDAAAMVQLGEQYSNEAAQLVNDASFDSRKPPAEVSRQYFYAAMQAGYLHAAAVIAAKEIDNNNLVEAWAWDKFSQFTNDPDRAALYHADQQFAGMSAEDKKVAEARYQEIARDFGLIGPDTESPATAANPAP